MLTLKQRYKIAAWVEVLQPVITIQQRFRALYESHYAPDRNAILSTHRKFIKTGSVINIPRSGQSEENVAAVREAFDLSQEKFVWRASSKLNISATTIQKIFRHELWLFPYKIQDIYKLESKDYDSRVQICETMLHHFQRDPFILKQM